MAYSDEDIRRHLRLGEDSAWEFKQVEFAGDQPRSPRRDDWANEIAAFANASGGALLCGVTDAGDVQGMSRAQMDGLERLLIEVARDSIAPPVTVNAFRAETDDGRAFILLEVEAGHALHRSRDGAFQRIGSSIRKMDGDAELRLAQRRGQARFRWFDEQPVPGTGFGTLNPVLWGPLLSAEGAAAPELALEKMGLLASDEHGTSRATVAGILLCTDAPDQWLPGACIVATRYRGTDRASGQIDAQVVSGPLDRQIAQALAFARRNMRVAAHKDPAREDMPQYSERALFEALVNAAVHRDYSIRGSRIRLSMYDDRLELRSPGSLPNTLTVESMGERQSTRNEVLASMLGRMPVRGIEGSGGRRYFIERRGDGIPIINRETRELSGERVEFRLIDDSELRLTIPAAPLETDPATAVITVRHHGQPLAGVDVLALFPNKTRKRATTDAHGEARLRLHSAHLPMTVFAAAVGYSAHLERDWRPAEGALALEMAHLPAGGSVIFPEETGHVPGLSGRLNPIRDTLNRTYLYASNVSIEGGRQQPVAFAPGQDLRLVDSAGREMLVRIVDIAGQSALIEYRDAP